MNWSSERQARIARATINAGNPISTARRVESMFREYRDGVGPNGLNAETMTLVQRKGGSVTVADMQALAAFVVDHQHGLRP